MAAWCCAAAPSVLACRQDSITLAKRRLSHDVQAAAAAPDRLPTRTADAAGDDNWNIPSQQQQQHAATTA